MYYLVFEGWMNYAKSKPSKIIKRFSFDFAVIYGKNDNKSALLLQYRDKLSFFVRKNATEWRGMNKHVTRHEQKCRFYLTRLLSFIEGFLLEKALVESEINLHRRGI